MPTPHLDELAAIDDALRGSLDGFTAVVKPNEARLVLGDGPDGEVGKLIEALQKAQPFIARAIELSRRMLEPFGPLPPYDAASLSALERHPVWHVRRLSKVLLADASRCFDAGDGKGSVERLNAAMRLSRELLRHHDHRVRMWGTTHVVEASSKIAAMVKADVALMGRVPAPVVDDLRSIYATIDQKDPDGRLAGWESVASEGIKSCRRDFAGPRGPAKWAESLRTSGVDAEAAARNRVVGLRDRWEDLVPHQQAAPHAASLSPSELSQVLDRAEAMVSPIVAALKAEDDAALKEALKPVRDDPTHLARACLGTADMILDSVRTSRMAIADGLRAAESLAR